MEYLDYFAPLEEQLLHGPRQPFTNARARGAGVYLVWEEGTVVFVETSEDLRTDLRQLQSTTHPFRQILHEHRLAELPVFRRRNPSDLELERLLADNFEISTVAVDAGRWELRERLIRRFRPRYNFRPA